MNNNIAKKLCALMTKLMFFVGISVQVGAIALASENSDSDTIFSTLQKACGARYEGAMTFPTEGQDSFAGKLLVAHISSCEEDIIRVPFAVGENQSRTWIFSRLEAGLQLKHDHRHSDGTPDEVTMYGGMAMPGGSASSTSFAADEHTADMIPEAKTNIWTLSFDPSGDQLTYHLERNSAPRFTAVLNRVEASD